MSGDLIIDLAGLLPAKRALDRLSRLDTQRLLEILGSEAESQTRRRLSEEKTDPTGRPWDKWSDDYGARRPAKGGILDLDGGLIDSIAFEVENDAITVGSNLVYALVHQEGWEEKNIPARPYLGVSADNLEDLGDLVIAFIAKAAAA